MKPSLRPISFGDYFGGNFVFKVIVSIQCSSCATMWLIFQISPKTKRNGVRRMVSQGTNCGLRVFLERGLTYPYRSRRGGGAYSVSSSGKCDLLKSLLREVTLFFYCFLKDALDIFWQLFGSFPMGGASKVEKYMIQGKPNISYGDHIVCFAQKSLESFNVPKSWVAYLWKTDVLNLCCLNLCWMRTEHPHLFSPDFGLWRMLDVPGWGLASWSWFLKGHSILYPQMFQMLALHLDLEGANNFLFKSWLGI